jgi:hypothetical protein
VQMDGKPMTCQPQDRATPCAVAMLMRTPV